eukprot:m.126203 g.126203  ORF g.126203 m.126203 type:complete len:144 (-) comp14510_c1_seq4:1626-2057(-)
MGGESQVLPGDKGVQVWDTDFGRISILICFDMNFFELWHEASALGAELIVWPTAMVTPDRVIIGHATSLRVPILACGHPGDVIGSDGVSLPQIRNTTQNAATSVAEIDLDEVWIHQVQSNIHIKLSQKFNNCIVLKEFAKFRV